MVTPPSKTLGIIGNGSGTAEAIGAHILEHHGFVLSDEGPADAMLVDAVGRDEAIPFDRLTDGDFARLYVEPTMHLEQVACAAVTRLKDGGALLFIGIDAYLGRADAAPQSAAAGSMVLLARSLSLWKSTLRSNALILPHRPGRRDEALVRDAAAMAATLLIAEAIKGQTILIDRGSHLASPLVAER